MEFKFRRNSRLARDLGPIAVSFLQYAIGGLTRLLPHVETVDWNVATAKKLESAGAKFFGVERRELTLSLGILVNNQNWTISGKLRRQKMPSGVGAISRTIDTRERDVADRVLRSMSEIFQTTRYNDKTTLSALRSVFDERVVAQHLEDRFSLNIDLLDWLASFRRLAEQSHENKSLVFGCIIDSSNKTAQTVDCDFPADFLKKKKYRALSDGYKTAYRISASGAVLGFSELQPVSAGHHRYFPEWCEELAAESNGDQIGISLIRQGDILIFDGGKLSFSYRLGRWQYWNHAHIVDLVTNAARVQHVKKKLLSGVVRSLYRAVLDTSFRRSGGLFVLLRRKKNLREIVRIGDAIKDANRDQVDRAFDRAMKSLQLTQLARSVLSELAALDGAVVISNAGAVLAFGAVLEPNNRRGTHVDEGSRTKAARGASHYGLALKVSSDGDITIFLEGRELIRV